MKLLNVGTASLFAAVLSLHTVMAASVADSQFKNNSQFNKNENKEQDATSTSTRLDSEACKQSFFVENINQLHQLASQCQTIGGSLNFNNYVDAVIDLKNIETIEGDLVMENSASIVRVECPKLTTIKGEFKIQSLTSLAAIHLRELNSVDSIYWRVVPILSTVEFTKGLNSVNKITISDTSLVGFNGFNDGKVEQLAVLNINNNRFMESVVCNIKSVSETLSIQSNARELQVSFENLIWANNMTIKDSDSISIPNLQFVNHSLEFIDNFFKIIEIPKLKGIGGTLSLDSNKELTEVDMNNVSDIFGGVMITKNKNLGKIHFLKSLQVIGGAIQFSGNIKEISFPKLRLIKGSVNIASTANDLDCSSWTAPPSGISIIRGGKILCSSGKQQTQISLSDKGEILNSDTTDLENQQNKDIVSKNIGNKIHLPGFMPLFVCAFLFIITIEFTKNFIN